MIATQVLSDPTRGMERSLSCTLRRIFGSPADSIADIDRRARELLPDKRLIIWEGDASTMEFSYVGGDAEQMLGHSPDRWTQEPAFWTQTVVHPEDRDEAIRFCSFETRKCEDHDFVCRAQTADGRTVWLHDIVTIVRGAKGVAERLRGIMLDVTPVDPAEPAIA